MVWLPDGEQTLGLFVSTESTNVTDGRTDRRTPTTPSCNPPANTVPKVYPLGENAPGGNPHTV